MSSRPPRILLSAGEASGDRLGAGLARALRQRRPDVELVGMGGERMADAGVRVIQDSHEVAVVGFLEVLSHLRPILGAMKKLERCLEQERPDLLVPIDFPDFNLGLARRSRKVGVEVVYFVSPQIWAWRRGRVRKIRRLVRRMLVLFPFEMRFYEEAGVPVSFVGHPVVEGLERSRSREELAALVGLDPSRPTVALMPGSRRGEVGRLLPVMLDAARLLAARFPGMQFLLPLAPGLPEAWVREMLAGDGLPEVHVHSGDFPEILVACTAGVVASGTASLEAALTGLPLAVVYRMSPVSFLIGRALVRVPHIALPNLVAGRRVVPELVQGDCTPPRIAEAVGAYLDDPGHAAEVREALAGVRGDLGGPGVFDRAADRILEELDAVRAARAAAV